MSFVDPPAAIPATSLADVDAKIEALWAKRDAWRKVSLTDRAKLLDRCIEGMLAVSEEWVDVVCRVKGVDPSSTLAGEEWVSGPVPSIRNARLFAEALRQGGKPNAPVRDVDGHKVARVFPNNLMEKIMFGGTHADVWIQPGKEPSQAGHYASGEGRVALVLGGGNVSSIPPMDVFYKLFVENEVVLLKMNPVNEAVGPVLEKALEPLVSGGWLAFAYGGADVGAHAAAHEKIGSLHVTGSDRTYDAIVWGGKKEVGLRVNDKPFSAELGCVTPVLVVPGPWSEADIAFQARHVASMITQNASFNCNAAKVVVVQKDWLQREAFLKALDEALARIPPRKAYYPGASSRYEAFLGKYPDARVVGEKAEGALPWTVFAIESEDYALKNEAFCGVVGVVTLDTKDFLADAVTFANEKCWGTLSCSILIHPSTESEDPEALPRAVAALRYGGIGINVFPGLIYALGTTTWGAFPGHTPEDIQSGTGVVHNAFLFDHPEKSVVRAPFRIKPTPAWFSDHKNLANLGKALVKFEAAPSWGKLASVVFAALKG